MLLTFIHIHLYYIVVNITINYYSDILYPYELSNSLVEFGKLVCYSILIWTLGVFRF